jgi:hypothetical protein
LPITEERVVARVAEAGDSSLDITRCPKASAAAARAAWIFDRFVPINLGFAFAQPRLRKLMRRRFVQSAPPGGDVEGNATRKGRRDAGLF